MLSTQRFGGIKDTRLGKLLFFYLPIALIGGVIVAVALLSQDSPSGASDSVPLIVNEGQGSSGYGANTYTSTIIATKRGNRCSFDVRFNRGGTNPFETNIDDEPCPTDDEDFDSLVQRVVKAFEDAVQQGKYNGDFMNGELFKRVVREAFVNAIYGAW